MSVREARKRAMLEIDRLGLTSRFESYGPFPVTTVVAALDDANSKLVATGIGKGGGAQSIASAVLEALENYYLQWPADGSAAGTFSWSSATELAAQPALQHDRLLQRWAAGRPAAVTYCAQFMPPGGGGPWLYPLFLSLPGYHLSPMPGDDWTSFAGYTRYSSGIGTAAGVSATECVLRAISELIEHDAFSHALLRWFLFDDQRRIAIARSSLSRGLARVVGHVEEKVGRIHILDITTDLRVPVMLAVPVDQFPGEPCYGVGASLDPGNAVRRAVLELLQTWWMAVLYPRNHSPAERLAPWPRLASCARLDMSGFPDAETVPLPSPVRRGVSATELLASISKLLSGHGIEYAMRTLTPRASSITVTTVIAPGLDRFSLVQSGVPVTPTGRACKLWEEAGEPR